MFETNKQRKDACKLYKAISEIFDLCYDLSEQQKHAIIAQCYKVAQDALAEQQQARQRDQMSSVSLGRRVV